MKNIKKLLMYLFLSTLLIVTYIELSHLWVNCGGVDSKNTNLELPIIIVLLLMFYFPMQKIFKNIMIATISILSLYILFDIFYIFLARSPRLSDVSNATMLSDFSPFFSVGLILLFGLFLIPFTYMFFRIKTSYVVFGMKVVLILSCIYFLGTTQFTDYLFKKFDYYSWSQSKTIKKNGRFTSLLYYSIISKKAEEKLASYQDKDIDINQILFGDSHLEIKPNIYIVVLESFIDPRLIDDANFSTSPLAKELIQYLSDGDFSHVISPIYGGGTSQAEFEILTGVKALAKVNSIEFNTLEGEEISGFTNLLKKNSYHIYATIASNSGYYNSKEAYRSIGFDETVFLEENNTFHKLKGDEKIFDGDVYNYNIKMLHEHKYKRPYLHYTLGMYGHFPYDRNLQRRPDIITTTHKNERVGRIANQFYYRTKALANYIDNILEMDSHAIIYITSDHLPPVLTNGVTYKKDQTENISLLIIDKVAINISGRKYYQIPRLIWKLMQKKDSTLQLIDENVYQDIYFKTLSQSLNDRH